MHKKYATFVLPIVGAAVVVGSGFAAWTFNQDLTAEQAINGTVVLEPDITMNSELEVDIQTFALKLDQGGVAEKDNLEKGITIQKNSTGDFTETLTATLTYKVTAQDTTANIANLAGKATGSVTPEYLGDMATWIVYAGDASVTWDAGTVSADNLSITFVGTAAIKYHYASKPTTSVEHDNLEAAVNALTDAQAVKLTFAVDVTA